MIKRFRLFPVIIDDMAVWVTRRRRYVDYHMGVWSGFQEKEWEYKFTVKDEAHRNKFSKTLIAKNKVDAIKKFTEEMNDRHIRI